MSLYRGFNIRHETEVDDPYCYAEGEDTTLLVDYSEEYFKPQIYKVAPTDSEVAEEAETKLRLLIDAYWLDAGFIDRLPSSWRDGYKFSTVTIAELKEAIDRIVPSPGQLPLYG